MINFTFQGRPKKDTPVVPCKPVGTKEKNLAAVFSIPKNLSVVSKSVPVVNKEVILHYVIETHMLFLDKIYRWNSASNLEILADIFILMPSENKTKISSKISFNTALQFKLINFL